jgi:hypothetical protein
MDPRHRLEKALHLIGGQVIELAAIAHNRFEQLDRFAEALEL